MPGTPRTSSWAQLPAPVALLTRALLRAAHTRWACLLIPASHACGVLPAHTWEHAARAACSPADAAQAY